MAKMTDEQKIEMVKLYKEGESSVALGKRYGITPHSVIKMLRVRNVKIRTYLCRRESNE